MIGLRRALVALGVVGALLAGLSVVVVLTSDHVDLRGLDAAVGVLLMSTFIGTGLFAWWRRPHNRIGALMTATGFAAFAATLTASSSSIVFTLGVAFGNLFLGIAVHMLLAFPSGRVESRFQRRLVVAVYVLAIGVSPLALLFAEDFTLDDPQIPENAFLVVDAPAVAVAIETAASLAAIVVIASIAAVLVRRWRTANPRDRSALAPVLLTGAVMVGLLVALFALQVAATDSAAAQAASWGALAAFAALPFAYLTGLVRSRAWRTGAVTELVAALGEAPARGDLRDALAGALADPTVELAYWLPERGVYIDDRGQPTEMPQAGDARVATEVERDGRRVGALVHDAGVCDDPELVRSVATAAALALDNERLAAELRARVEELHASRQRILEAGLAERRRLERDLHDGAQQRLVSLSLQLGLVEAQLERDPAAARAVLANAREEARAALEELRELARGIHPAVLTDRGLGAAVEALASRAPLPVEVTTMPEERLPPAVEAAAYFVVAEALTNVVKYAQASHAEVSVERVNGHAVVEVRDDGGGGADPGAGSGLRGLADRLSALDGRLRVDSPHGAGTVVRAEVPCASS